MVKAALTTGRFFRGRESLSRVIRQVLSTLSAVKDRNLAQQMAALNQVFWTDQTKIQVGWVRAIYVHQLPSGTKRILLRENVCVSAISYFVHHEKLFSCTATLHVIMFLFLVCLNVPSSPPTNSKVYVQTHKPGQTKIIIMDLI